MGIVWVGAGCSSGSTHPLPRPAPNRVSATTPASRPPPSSLLRPGLPQRLISAVLPGFVVQPDTLAGTGAIDLAKAAAGDGSGDAAAVLRRDGFVAGYERLWRGGGGAQLLVSVYQFASDDGARAYFTREVADALRPDGAISPMRVRTAPAPGSVEVDVAAAGVARVLVPRGDYLAVINLQAATGSAPPDAAVAQLASAEYRLLA